MHAEMLDRQPVLAGDLVLLRPLHAEDWGDLFAVAADPEIWAMHPMHDRWKEGVFRAFFDDALEHQGALVAIDRQSGTVIGSSRFQDLSEQAGGSVEIGWTFLARSHWGTGHNRDMKRLMVGHALASLARVDFRVGEANMRSRRAMEKIGAQLDRSRVQRAQVPGVGEVVHLYYTIDRKGFAKVLGAT